MANFDNVTDFEAQKAKIAIVGCGGGGNNTITALFNKGLDGATTVAINTDAKHLMITKAHNKVLIGKSLTKGLGAGGYPEVGKNAALESKNDLRQVLSGTDLVFVTCGLGGGTGTGSVPVIAKLAKDSGAIVIGAVTLPFKLEGARIVKAEEGLVNLREVCDTVIVIENQRLLELAGKMPLKQAFAIADDLIATMIKGIIDTISLPSLVNMDFADVRAVMRSGGVAAIGVGTSEESDSKKRSLEAVTRALNHPLLEVDYQGASGALIQIVGGDDLKLADINIIGEAVQRNLDPEAMVKIGARIDDNFKHKIHVITIITGVKSPYLLGPSARKFSASKMAGELGIEVLK
ncbi:MAG: cell division protein FtsZ [Candidatus Aenigmarchaeota archaeon]|nr:cell division protein FtsZ [Candidatus Aenigmarchaeota archaeon]